MGPIGDHFESWNSAAQNRAARRHALEKPSATSSFSQAHGKETPPGGDHSQEDGHETLRHSGTAFAVPLRHAGEMQAPRLTSAFVAQLLGQILPDREPRKLPAGISYGPEEHRTRLLLDAKV